MPAWARCCLATRCCTTWSSSCNKPRRGVTMSIEDVKVLAVPTVTRLSPETRGSVLVGGSHAAIYTTYLTLKAGARAAIQHDAAFGRDQAGIAGMAWAE